MSVPKRYAGVRKYIKEHPHSVEAYEDWFELARDAKDVEVCKVILKGIAAVVGDESAGMKTRKRGHELMKKLHLMLAEKYFHHYCIYLEWNREPSKRFYQPRMRALYPLTDALQKLEDDELDLVCISLPPGVGKTTLALFYLTWVGGKHPELQILESSHNVAFLRGCYDEIQRIIDPDGEYLYNDVFPNSPKVNTNAKDLRIDLQTEKRFETFQFTSIGAGNAGKVRATSLLYCDDLVDGIETAVNVVQLDKLWNMYATDLRQRKQGYRCKELHIATRWSVHDIIGRLEDQHGNDKRAKFINVPALNANDESNFDYPYGLGFSTEMYKDLRSTMNEMDWNALYMGQPIEREGLLFPTESLQRFYDLPEDEPDAILAVCDTKDKGDDYFCMPICYQYGNQFYVADVVYDNQLPEAVMPRMANKMVQHGVKQCRFESNSAGGRIATEVERMIRERGGYTKITTKYTTQNKETKILVNADFVKDHMLFKDDTKCNKEYMDFLRALTGYTHMGKNRHDDAPDAVTMFAEFVQQNYSTKIEIRQRFF